MNYLVDFKVLRANPSQNRTYFSFTLADSFKQAALNILRYHRHETVEILGVFKAPDYERRKLVNRWVVPELSS